MSNDLMGTVLDRHVQPTVLRIRVATTGQEVVLRYLHEEDFRTAKRIYIREASETRA